MTKLATIGLAAATATGMILAPLASAAAQTFDHSAVQKAQFFHRDRDRGFHRDRDRSRFGFGIYVGPNYDYDYGYDRYYCSSHWRWDGFSGRWVLVRDCD
jgi:Ni/Co efflux regulator RcnB